MAFSNLVGQKKNIEKFEKTYRQDRFAHAYLFYGDNGTGKLTFSFELSKILLCSNNEFDYCNHCPDCLKFNKMEHPNLHFILPVYKDIEPETLYELQMQLLNNPYKNISFPKATSISIDTIRELKKRLSLTSFFGKKVIIIIHNADQMTIEANNSLLKILEEPPPETVFLLTTDYLQYIIPTIKSRCHLINFPIISKEEISLALKESKQIPHKLSAAIAEHSFGSYGRALELLEEDFSERRKFLLSIIKKIFSSSKADLLNLSETLTKEKDRGFIKDILRGIALELRLLMKKYDGIPPKGSIIETVELDLFNHKKNRMDIPGMITEIEKSIDLIDKNIYLTILLTVLFFRLNSKLCT